MEIVAMLQNSELFKGLAPGYLNKVSGYCVGRSFNPDSLIFKEGDPATDLYVLTGGRVALETEVRPIADLPAISFSVETIVEGGVLGWSAIVEPHVYTRSARCLSNCALLAIKGEILSKVMREDPAFGFELMKRLSALISRRLTNTQLRLVNVIGVAMLEKDIKARV